MKDLIIQLLLDTKREGIQSLVDYMVESGFFTAPASTKYHGCFQGGLAAHSYRVYELLKHYNTELNLNIPADSLIIAPLLHDVCKIGAYLGDVKPYTWNRQQPKGHALLSLDRVNLFIKLTDIETKMIQYHMGVYGLKEFEEKGEYNLRGGGMANAWYHFPAVKIMYFCDEIATLMEKVNE